MAKRHVSTEHEGGVAVAKRYRVKLHASTYLLHPEAVIEADNDAEAWEKFCAMNSISGSTCDREINEVKE